ncbi:MAG: hypothetical protein RL477_1991 [Pseudomonadota bacterium]|jgi:tripartite-type tricarboxylate transporter receptor subunit TctC
MRIRLAWLAAIAAGAVQSPAPAMAEDFYKGKQVTVYVGYPTGGGYDTNARTFARHIRDHLAGRPDTVVKNMPGAGSMKLALYLYNTARKDGREIGAVGREIPTGALMGLPNAVYSASKFNWIGSMGSEGTWCFAWHTAPFKTAEDMMRRQFIVGATTGQSITVTGPIILNNLLGTKIKVIAGYPGSSEMHLAMERGEIQGRCAATLSSVNVGRPDWIREKKVVFLLDVSLSSRRNMPDVPLVTEFARRPEDRQALELILAPDSWTRPVTAPPGLPAERVRELRAAFDAMIKDAKFIADMERQKQVLDVLSGAEMAARIEKLEQLPPAIVKAALDAAKKTEGTEMGKVEIKAETLAGTIAAAEDGGRKVTYAAAGKKGTLDVSTSGTSVTIAGKKAARKELKAGMACEFVFRGTEAKSIVCR